MSRYMLFLVADLKLAIRAGQVKAVHEQLDVQKVAGTANWFLGVGVANGRLLPVTDLGAFIRKQPCSGRILELDQSVGIAALRVDEVIGFSDAQTPLVKPSEDMVDDINQYLLIDDKSVKHEGGEYHMLDAYALVQSPLFINIKDNNS